MQTNHAASRMKERSGLFSFRVAFSTADILREQCSLVEPVQFHPHTRSTK
jgi:hypothetical protein